MLDRQGDLTRTNAIELIYEGEIHRLLKKTYSSISKDAIFFTNVLKKILKTLFVLKNQRVGLAIWLQFNTVISLVQLSEQALRLICSCLKPYFSRQRHLRYPFRLWSFE
jgi:GntR family transcriptional regulator/MocR family aminotransferase